MEKHLTKENLELESQKISECIQMANFKFQGIPASEVKEIYTDEEKQLAYTFLVGANYGMFLLMKYIERGETQPYTKFIKEEIKRLNILRRKDE